MSPKLDHQRQEFHYTPGYETGNGFSSAAFTVAVRCALVRMYVYRRDGVFLGYFRQCTEIDSSLIYMWTIDSNKHLDIIVARGVLNLESSKTVLK